ncbi:MAG: hypothetical protein ACTSRG_22555 [Candidatus Helarchaeota archaeon]
MTFDPDKTYLELTGNIFVDQGQITLQCMLNKPLSSRISVSDIMNLKASNEIYGIKWIAKNLDRFDSFSMLYTTNHMKMQSGFKPDNEKIFLKFLELLIDEIYNQYNPDNKEKPEMCDICGLRYNFNFDEGYEEILKENHSKYNPKKRDINFRCRNFFPLAGSMGSESQTFSNMSIAPNICPRCLFVIYYLPFSAQVIEGNLAIFQSSNLEIQYDMAKVLTSEYQKIIGLTSAKAKFPNIGKKLKSKNQRIFESFFEYFQMILPTSPTRSDYQDKFPDKNLQIILWKYSNSGQGPFLDIEHIPNTAILFIYLSYCLDLKNTLIDLIKEENKRIKYPPNLLYNCIRSKRLYKFENLISKKFQVDPKLQFLYYYYILGLSRREIEILVMISRQIQSMFKSKENLERSLKKYSQIKIFINKAIRELIKNNKIKMNDYYLTFTLLPTSKKAKVSSSIIIQLLKTNTTLKDFESFDENIKNLFDAKAIEEYFKSSEKSFEQLIKDEEKFISNVLFHLHEYLKQRFHDAKEFKDFILNRLRRTKKAWGLIILYQVILLRHLNFTYGSYIYFIELSGSWNNFLNLMAHIFLIWTNEPELLEIFKNYSADVPLEYSVKFHNQNIEDFFYNYLKLRIQILQKGMNYIKSALIMPLIKGKISLNQLYYIIERHADELGFSKEQDFYDRWELIQKNPNTNLQDAGYFMIYLKFYLVNQINKGLKERLEVIEEELDEETDEIEEFVLHDEIIEEEEVHNEKDTDLTSPEDMELEEKFIYHDNFE